MTTRPGTTAAMQKAARRLEDGATVEELKAAIQDLRALAPDSALADFVEERLAIEEKLVELERRIRVQRDTPTGS